MNGMQIKTQGYSQWGGGVHWLGMSINDNLCTCGISYVCTKEKSLHCNRSMLLSCFDKKCLILQVSMSAIHQKCEQSCSVTASAHHT